MTAHVYTFRAIDGTVLYVGCTERIGRRLLQHEYKPWWPEVVRIDSVAFATLAEARLAETSRIRQLQPVHNTVMTDHREDPGGWATRRRREALKAAALVEATA
jgi:excinuclease UvrABC nuclease subunit